MICPYCGEELEMYEFLEDYHDDDHDTVDIEEHWVCNNCDRTFYREMSYKATKKGMLEE